MNRTQTFIHHNSSVMAGTDPDEDTAAGDTTDDEVTEGLSCIGHDLIQHRMLSQKNEDTDTNVTLNQAGIRRKLIAVAGSQKQQSNANVFAPFSLSSTNISLPLNPSSAAIPMKNTATQTGVNAN